MIFKFLHVQKPNPLDFKDFKELACAEAQIFRFLRFWGFGMCRRQHIWISKIVRIWHVQKPKSFDFNNFYDLACAEAQLVGFQ